MLAVTTTAALAFTAFGAAPAFAADPAALATHTIADVQGTGAATPIPGQTVTVDGIVTADHRTGGYRGIYVQTPGVGGDVDPSPGASDGIFVFLGNNQAAGIAIGDQVSVTGAVSEFNAVTQITASAAGAVALVTAGVGLPAPVPLPDSVRGDAREAYEGMLVAPTGSYSLASSHSLFSFGELWLNAGAAPAIKNTELVGPGDEATAIAAANKGARLLVDDGYSARVDAATHVGEQPYFTKDTVVRNGDTAVFPDAGMVLSYAFNEWRLQPQLPLTDSSDAALKVSFTPVNVRQDAPPAVGGDVKLASFNVFNYFTTLSSVNSGARGAATQAEFDIQKSKIVAAINGLDADVVALMEIENSVKLATPADIDHALNDLVAGLNAATGSEVWAAVPTPAALNDAAITDFITSAIIYKKDAATPVGASKTVIDETVWDIAREPIAQTFTLGARTVTVVANHFKSKSAPSGNTAPEPADGQGFFNAERTEQAQALLAFSQQLQADSGSDDVFLIGDFNAYAHEDPINVFTAAGWSDLVPAKAPGQYTYTFSGELGSLDHVLASPSVAPRVTGAGVWGINSPEWGDRGYEFAATEAGTPFRSSDHDPIVVGLNSEAVPVDINVVTVNDFHGRIEQLAPSGGAAVLAGAVKQIRDANPNTVFAAAGDLIGASTFTSFIQQDNPTIDALNAAGLDVSSVGNHEFDQGFADLTDRVIPRANWEYLVANVYDKTTGKPALDEYYTETFDGVTIGFIGAVTEELPSLVSPAGIANLEVRDTVTEVNRVADQLRDGDPSNGEADVVILLIHEGAATTAISSATDPNSAFGKVVTGVDGDVNAIVSGHTHLAYNHVIDGRPVISSGQYGEKFGLMDISVNPQTKELLEISNQTLPLMTDPIPATPTTPAVPAKPLYPAVPEVQTIVDDAVAVAAVLGAKKLGDITAPFNRAKLANGTTENRGGESTLGNFVADVQLWATQSANAQIAFMNPGGLRTDMPYASSGPTDPDGNVTYREAAIVQPFANTLVAMDLTGAQLRAVLEQQWQPAGASRPFLKLGVSEGLVYDYNPAGASGARIGTITLNGAVIDPAASYRVTVNSFLASGGDNFTILASGTNRADTGKVDLAAMVDYLAANSPAAPDYAQRAVGVVLTPPAAAAGYVAGESVTVTLSSLAFGDASTPAPGTVNLSLGGAVLASAPVDATVGTAVFDETGTATAQITIPAGIDGVQQLAVTVAATGTAVNVPITIQKVVAPVKVSSLTVGAPSKLLAKAGSTVQYTVSVLAVSGPRPTGTVEVLDGNKVIATIQLTAKDKGQAKVNLPKLSSGVHLLKARYLGSDTVKASTGLTLPLILW
ncbi:ExeM/NucH family extracellular endonuclease [Microterricola viridarii]|uniref:5'-nucleotidase n=1 Tax=Microterricola viridarii TaxID=412690 RepID=A0A1H1P4K2_9MICO|nr:ExeM/NucH family extracellular endonuclease [Microterricola viridarii]SDS05960.1 5'-nucleotidase [Microterricola viridarii]